MAARTASLDRDVELAKDNIPVPGVASYAWTRHWLDRHQLFSSSPAIECSIPSVLNAMMGLDPGSGCGNRDMLPCSPTPPMRCTDPVAAPTRPQSVASLLARTAGMSHTAALVATRAFESYDSSMRKPALGCLLISAELLLTLFSFAAPKVTIYSAPPGEPLAGAFKLQVEGRDVPVYQLRVSPQNSALRINAVEDKSQTGTNFEDAGFAYFDAAGSVNITVTYATPVTAARLLPASSGSRVSIQGSTIRFTVSPPQNITLEVNHELVRTLHIFVNPPETDAPAPKDANVLYFGPGEHQLSDLKVPQSKTILYFGPGIHTIDNLVVRSGQTVYIAGGAVVRSVIKQGAAWVPSTYGGQTSKLYTEPAIRLTGANIKLRGRGILDGSPSLGKRILSIEGKDISLQDLILKNSGNWFMPIFYSDRISVTNMKILGYRANSDGIDITSSRDVTVEGCFIRTVDDVIVVKTKLRKGTTATESDKVNNIVVRGNRLWNETGGALKIGTEVSADISGVTFTDNDVIRDLARGATEGIYLAGSGTVSNVRFENTRTDRTGNAFDKNGATWVVFAYIRPSEWESNADRNRPLGKIRNIVFSNTQVTTSPQTAKVRIDLLGASESSDIENVKFENFTVNGKPLLKSNILLNEKFATQITGLP